MRQNKMKFGFEENSALVENLNLPLDGLFTNEILRKKGRAKNLKVFVGASKWGEKTWKGKIYPKGLKEGDFLNAYSKIFNAVEFGSTFYNPQKAENIQKWASQAEGSSDFNFCPKFPQAISHVRRLKNAGKETTAFYESVGEFGDKLGPLMLQLSNNFSPKSFPELKSYIETLPKDKKVFVEMRHKDWFNEVYINQLMQLLSNHHIGTVISDTTGRRDCVHMNLTTKDALIRFVGNDLHETDYVRMDDWVNRLKTWVDHGLENIWFFMHQNDEQFVPEATIYFIKKLNAALDINLNVPQILHLF